ncbi:MAG: hypothetical protein AAGC92_07240 [Pseudomonadota bacterium]
MRQVSGATLAGGLALAALPVSASDLLTIDVVVPGGPDTAPGTFSDAETLIDSLNENGYESINPAYSDSAPATANVNYRGVDIVVRYPDGGETVIFEIPSTGFSETFDDFEDRSANEDALVDFLESNQDGVFTQVLQEAVANTPSDPVAGTPSSLMSKMVEADFTMGTTIGPEPNQVASANEGYNRTRSSFGLNARFGSFTADDTEINVVDLPLNWSRPLDDPRYAVILDLPLTYVETEGTDSFSGSMGLGLRLPLYDNWTLTPAIRGGVVGSLDLGAAAALGGVSLVSNYRFSYEQFDFGIGNSVAYLQTFPLDIDGVEFDYDLQNVVLRNGISVSGPLGFKIFGQNATWEGSVVNTLFFGDELYAENVTDIAFSLGTVQSLNGFTWDSFRIGVTYTFSADSDYEGFRLNFGYRF